MVDAPGADRFSLRCLETERSAPQVIRRWRRRSWIAFGWRTLQPLWATAACQGHSEDAADGPLGWRLLGCFGLCSTSRVSCKGKLTREESIFSVQHSWRFVDWEAWE